MYDITALAGFSNCQLRDKVPGPVAKLNSSSSLGRVRLFCGRVSHLVQGAFQQGNTGYLKLGTLIRYIVRT